MTKKKTGADNRPLSPKTILVLAATGCAIIVAIVVIVALTLGKEDEQSIDNSSLLADVSGYSGYSRTVSQEEYDFFYDIVKRNLYSGQDGADVDQLTRDYIGEVNARFYLGSKLGLCEPYSFATLKYRMEQENEIRKAKLEAGEAVYGATQFTLLSYFNYVDSNLESDILNYLIEHADQAMLEQAEEYYNAHLSVFEVLVSITYSLEHNGQTETETIDSAGLRTLQNAGGELGEFLVSAQPGDVLEYESPDGDALRATLVDAVYETPSFEDAESTAVRSWLNVEVMDGLYETLSQNNPVVFDLES